MLIEDGGLQPGELRKSLDEAKVLAGLTPIESQTLDMQFVVDSASSKPLCAITEEAELPGAQIERPAVLKKVTDTIVNHAMCSQTT